MPDYVFEVSSEAARKVGGIYTVLMSKTKYLVDKYKDNYMLIGFCDERCEGEIKDEVPPADLIPVFTEMEKLGVKCRYGRWVYGSNALVILLQTKYFGEAMVEYVNGAPKKDRQVNYFKFLLWKSFNIDSLMEQSWDFQENVCWGFAVGMLLEKMLKLERFKAKDTVCQFHEWISGAALLYCKMQNVPVATVFTTHATVLGRTLASFGKDVLQDASVPGASINVSEAYRFKVEGKHQLEARAAANADVFTTVSSTVADEVLYILGRKPDIITLNGMDFSTAETKKQVLDLSAYSRAEVVQFTESYFIPYYVQSYKDPLIVFISGRYEYTNKGFDIFIEALGKLNKRLKKQKTERRIFAYIFAPSAVRGPRIPAIRNYLLLDKISEVMEQIPEMKGKEYANLQEAMAQLTGDVKYDVVNMLKGFIKEGDRPLINCYDLNYANDKIVGSCYEAGLTNAEDDVVKVIFYPTYLKPNDGLLGMNYYDAISGMDIGIFPSRYEPFGYTPVEAGLKMNIAITSDTTGFGRYMASRVDTTGRGVRVLKMFGEHKDNVTDELANELQQIYSLSTDEIKKLKEDSFKLVRLCDWKELINNYYKAYDLAVVKHKLPPAPNPAPAPAAMPQK